MKTDRTKIWAGVLALCGLALGGCETTLPKTADYWPESTYLTVVVHSGDTVSHIAERYHVSVGTVERLNDLNAMASIYPGETLKVPANSHETRTAVLHEASQPKYAIWNSPGKISQPAVEVHELKVPPSNHAVSRHIETAQDDARAAHVMPSPAPRHDNLTDEASAEIQAAASGRKSGNTSTPKQKLASVKVPDAILMSTGEFAWPVEGKIIAAFGRVGDGQRNDGINIAANLGEPIHAAAAGTVTYAGNELKDYGNLVLIKHDNGYVTAYAHAESITVTRGDKVGQGQVIGYAGKTGDVSTPQLHFEIRQGVKPVDPKPLLLTSRES
ncbi:MAG TPA: M23 family metallopeptidase [Rhizomicrobium sp.]